MSYGNHTDSRYSDSHRGGGSYGGVYGGGGQGAGGGRGKDDLDDKRLPAADFSNLSKFEKNFYLEHPAVTSRSDQEVSAYRRLRCVF